jgi:3'(2'), 5'-bisphosphate nucleotidase
MSTTDSELARAIATGAGKLLLTLQRSKPFDGKSMGKAGDRIANAFIMNALKEHRPDDAVLGRMPSQ